MDSLQGVYSPGKNEYQKVQNEYHIRDGAGYKCHEVKAKELLKQAVIKMTRPPSSSRKDKNNNKNSNNKNKKTSGGTLWKKAKALEKLVKAAEKAGEEHVEKGKNLIVKCVIPLQRHSNTTNSAIRK